LLQTTITSKPENGAKIRVKSETTKPTTKPKRGTNNVTKVSPNRTRRDDGSTTSSADVAGAAASGDGGVGVAPTRTTSTQPGRKDSNHSIEEDSSGVRVHDAGKQRSSPMDAKTKSTGGTKQGGGGGGILARGQKLLKQLRQQDRK